MPTHFQAMNLSEQLADLERIASLENAVLRNLLITQRYHDLSHLLAKVMGPQNANWSTFATWASKTAGISIREEDIPDEFAEFLRREARLDARLDKIRGKLGPLKFILPDLDPFELARAIIREVSEQIAEGNLRVYHELSPLFAEFADTFANETGRSKEKLDAFVDKLEPGPPDRGGQECLKKAFSAYFEAAHCQDPSEKAQLLLYGNVLIGFHEQTRLQDNIAGAIGAPFSARVYERFGAFGPKFLHPVFRGAIQMIIGFLSRELLDDWERIATRFMMKLSAPNGDEIPLDEDLPGDSFPPTLEELRLQELRALLGKFDPNFETTKGSGAYNWTVLEDRMGFIGELFRVKQCSPPWFGQPFAPEVRDDIEAGRTPKKFAPRLPTSATGSAVA